MRLKGTILIQRHTFYSLLIRKEKKMDKEIIQMIDTLTNSLDLLVQTQRKTQEFMQEQLNVNKILIQRIKKLEVETNVIKTEEPVAINDIFDTMINRFKKENNDAEKS
jgi:hypothetical protein